MSRESFSFHGLFNGLLLLLVVVVVLYVEGEDEGVVVSLLLVGIVGMLFMLMAKLGVRETMVVL